MDDAQAPGPAPHRKPIDIVLGPENIVRASRQPIGNFPSTLAYMVFRWPCRGQVIGEPDGTLAGCGETCVAAALDSDPEWLEAVLEGRQSETACGHCGQPMRVRRAKVVLTRGQLSMVGSRDGRGK